MKNIKYIYFLNWIGNGNLTHFTVCITLINILFLSTTSYKNESLLDLFEI